MLLDNAREVVATSLGVRRDEVFFTASGSEAVHLGVLGLLAGSRASTLLAGAVEHSAVLHAGAFHTGPLELLPVSSLGRLPAATVRAALPADPCVLACQSANHEVGTVQPLAEIAAVLRPDDQLFVDACAAAGWLDLPADWAAAALSAHKWGGPSGIGVLLVRRSARWVHPFVTDNRYERQLVGENVPLVLAAAAALQAVLAEREAELPRQHALIATVRERVAQLPGVLVLGDPDDRLPHVVTFCVPGVDGESVVEALDADGFQVASGSACTASTLEPSHVLVAMGAPTTGNIRVSVGRDTTAEDVDRFLATLPVVLERLG